MTNKYYIAEVEGKGFVGVDRIGKNPNKMIMFTTNIMDAHPFFEEINAKRMAIAAVGQFELPTYTPIKVHEIGIVTTPVQCTAGFDMKMWNEINS